MTDYELAHRFGYHRPSSEKIVKQHERTREMFLALARYVMITVPSSREQSLAITALEEGMFWTNAGIARINNYTQQTREPVDTAIDTGSRTTFTKFDDNDYAAMSRGTRICPECKQEYPYGSKHEH